LLLMSKRCLRLQLHKSIQIKFFLVVFQDNGQASDARVELDLRRCRSRSSFRFWSLLINVIRFAELFCLRNSTYIIQIHMQRRNKLVYSCWTRNPLWLHYL